MVVVIIALTAAALVVVAIALWCLVGLCWDAVDDGWRMKRIRRRMKRTAEEAQRDIERIEAGQEPLHLAAEFEWQKKLDGHVDSVRRWFP